MDDAKFWSMIEDAWSAESAETNAARAGLSSEDADEETAYQLMEPMHETVLPRLKEALKQLSQEDLLAFDRILERKLYDIDREEIHEYTDGSDDGFLYCRGFIVAAGQGHYDAVNADPSKAICDAECESITYLSAFVYEDLFGEIPKSDICRESFSNLEHWD